MSSKVNIWKILKDHKATLVDQNTDKPGGDDILFFLLIPVLSPILIVYVLGFDFGNYLDLRKTIVSSLAIFVGLLFNALVVLINIAKNGDTKNIRKKVIQQLIANISFNIIIAFIAVLFILIRYIQIPSFVEVKYLPSTTQIIDIISIGLLMSFFLTFLMIMKRTYLIINTEVEKTHDNK